jgi:phage gpG-like protein
MKVRWQVDDGYAGGSRPQSLNLPDRDFEDMTEEEKETYINDCVQEDFNNKISWHIISKE